MVNVPEYPDYDAKRAELFPGKARWELTQDENREVKQSMSGVEEDFRKEKDRWARYLTMVGNSTIKLMIARNDSAMPSAEHTPAHVLTKKEAHKANRFRMQTSVPPVSQDTWEVSLPQGEGTQSLIAPAYLMFTEYGSDSSHVMKYVENESLPLFYDALETARVSIQAGQWYGRKDDVRRALAHSFQTARNQNTKPQDEAKAPFDAVWAQALGINPWDVMSVEQSDAAVFAQGFASEITRAINHADDSAVIDVAIQLAAQHEIMFQKATVCDYPVPSDEEDEPSEEEEREVVALSEDGEEVATDVDSADDGADEADSDDTSYGPSPLAQYERWKQSQSTPDDVDNPGDITVPVITPATLNLSDVKEEIAKDIKTALSKKKGQQTRKDNKLQEVSNTVGMVQISYAGDHLLNIYPSPAQEKLPPSPASLDIKQARGINSSTQHYVGEPTQKVWEIGIGNTKVFQRRSASRGRVGILIDISGSMGCGCNQCSNSYGSSSARLAYASAQALYELDNDAIVAAYCGEDEIYRLAGGHTLTHAAYGNTGGATPTCAALEWLEKAMGGELEGASCVLITDGYPSACGARKKPEEHTSEIAHRMYQSGMRFGCVVVHSHAEIAQSLPSPVTVMVNKLDDLDKIQTILDAMGDK